jgi:hypothetical protein
MRVLIHFSVCFLACLTLASAHAGEPVKYRWAVGDPILGPGPQGSFDEVAVKDPSLVFFEGKWHVFYTARSRTEYTTGYVCAKELDGLQSAPRHELKMIRGRSRYGCAPQVFYYEPQGKWYLIFQNRDANYQPVYATTTTISKPESWSKPLPLLRKDARAKWIDFWVICDETRAYLFYTQAHRAVVVRSTNLEAFPKGWGAGQEVLDGVHEAVHIYRARGGPGYHMIYELNRGGIRSFGLARAENLKGSWTKVTDDYASGDQLSYTGKTALWTDMVSHGEVIRSGHDQRMEYDPRGCRWLIQGILKEDSDLAYPSLRWKLGLMKKVEGGGGESPVGEMPELVPEP